MNLLIFLVCLAASILELVIFIWVDGSKVHKEGKVIMKGICNNSFFHPTLYHFIDIKYINYWNRYKIKRIKVAKNIYNIYNIGNTILVP